MTFSPTKEQLEELGFNITAYSSDLWLSINTAIAYTDKYKWKIIIESWDWIDVSSDFYPQSIEDIQTLIKLLTPPN